MNSLWVVLGLVVLALAAWGLVRLRGVKSGAPVLGQGMVAMASGQSQLEPATPRGYSPKNVGNDASARPWESAYGDGQDASSPDEPWVPAGFDTEAFLVASKTNFIGLQDAWDRADIPSLRAMMTDDMLEQIQGQLSEREQQRGGLSGKTEVVMVEARLLGIEDLGEGHMANVEFSGLMREDGAGPNPFREIWSISRAKSGDGGWLVAGVQALQ